MSPHVLGFEEIDRTKLSLVGGKALSLGELARIAGLSVPSGFCVTTDAFRAAIGQNPRLDGLLAQLSSLGLEDRVGISQASRSIRTVIEGADIAPHIAGDIARHLSRLGGEAAYAVRSSATAEDLPLASFAGQQDTYLNVRGRDAILGSVRKCWASLFSERAVIYRMQHGFAHRGVFMAVVVQRMLFPQVAGVMFTADPVTSNRKVLSIDASFGLGEALVSGAVSPDVYRVRGGRVVAKTISVKKVAVCAAAAGGTEERAIEPGRQHQQTLSRDEIVRLEGMGRKIEAHFGCPQDIEWCATWPEPADVHSAARGGGRARSRSAEFHVLQSRPMTTLFPIPENDGHMRVYVSVGHQQMMTDAMRPLGMSIFGFLYQGRPFSKAGGRVFLDLTSNLASPAGRRRLLRSIGASDPLMRNAITAAVRRRSLMASLVRGQGESGRSGGRGGSVVSMATRRPAGATRLQPGAIQDLIARSEASISDLRQRIASVSGDDLFDCILHDQDELKAILFDPRSFAVLNAGMAALGWLNRNMERWLGEVGVAGTLSRSVTHNVTSEMGLALLDVADVVRQYPAVIDYLDHPNAESFFDDLAALAGGDAVSRALRAYLAAYGMRCPGEIDITRPRWSEQPTALMPTLLSDVRNCEPNARAVRFERGRMQAEQKERELLSRLEELPGGERRAKETRRMIRILRSAIGYREYPKYAYIRRYWIYKQALLKEAAALVQQGIIREQEDTYYLTFEEFRGVVRNHKLDHSLIERRKHEHAIHERLTPPRVMTSEGEVIFGDGIRGDIPRGALSGIPVSSGIVEGRARVLLRLEDAAVGESDILVTRFTDPSWTPLFVSVKGLVTEVGGVLTHGAVIAREYGLPAVVSVEGATTRIKDGQWIRVNGRAGYVEVL